MHRAQSELFSYRCNHYINIISGVVGEEDEDVR